MKRYLIVCMAVMGVLLSACGLAGAKALKAGEDMNGQTVEFEVGQKLQISLEGNPTTGFNWELLEYDPAVLKQVGDMEYKSDSKLMGAGGVMTFTFEALKSGDTRLRLIYHRGWETEVPPEKTYELDVSVK